MRISVPGARVRIPGQDRSRSAAPAAHRFLEEWGSTPFSRIALLPGYSYAFVAGGRCLVPFVRRGRRVLALGDPVGPLAERRRAVAEFSSLCRERSLRPAFVPVGGNGDPREYPALGFRLLKIGDEAHLPLGRFRLAGNRRKSLRQSRNRLRRLGYRFRILDPPHPEAVLRALEDVSRSWLAARRLPERRFGSGWFHPAYVARFPAAILEATDGTAAAFATVLDGYDSGEATVDLMRHRPGSPSGTMDALFAGLALHFRDAGRSRFNLGLAPLRAAGDGPTIERGLRLAARPLERFFDFDGLAAFKAKFRPKWRPRFLAYPSLRDLPGTLATLAEIGPGAVVRGWGRTILNQAR